MVINWYGEGCFKAQIGDFTLVTDVFSAPQCGAGSASGGDTHIGSGLNPARGKFDVLLKTICAWPIQQKNENENGEGTVLVGPGEYEIKGFEIKGLPLVKESTDKFLKTVYLVKTEDANLCFLGHIADYPDEDILEELEHIDVLFIPAGGKPFLKQELAAKLIKQISPKIVVPMFLKVPGLKRPSADIKDFSDELGIKSENEEKLTIKKKDLAESKSIKLIQLKI